MLTTSFTRESRLASLVLTSLSLGFLISFTHMFLSFQAHTYPHSVFILLVLASCYFTHVFHAVHLLVACMYTGFKIVNVSELVKEKSLHSGKHEDEELDSIRPLSSFSLPFPLPRNQAYAPLHACSSSKKKAQPFHTTVYLPTSRHT